MTLILCGCFILIFFFQAEDGIRDVAVTGVQTCALPISQVLEHGETAWLVPPGNPAELASAIELLAQDPDLRRRLGRNARAAALARHTWRQNVERVLSRSKCSPVRNFAPAGSKAETRKA